jgi:predicted nucleic acid-binding protein
MNADVFFDTNVLVYFNSWNEPKARRSAALLTEGGIVSVQVLNEFVNVARRERSMSWPAIELVLRSIKTACRVVPLTIETHERGVALARPHNFAVYDAMIVAAAQLAGCRTLYTEDLHNGLVVDGLRIINPYALSRPRPPPPSPARGRKCSEATTR